MTGRQPLTRSKPSFSLDLATFDSGDVLDNFDFDNFLHTDDNEFGNFGGMNFDDTGLTADGS
ncbi:MAG: hypothetical protein INR71_04135 [Terriglobus roseus]|nr:hypothetical protein [Terriglobus roseus]